MSCVLARRSACSSTSVLIGTPLSFGASKNELSARTTVGFGKMAGDLNTSWDGRSDPSRAAQRPAECVALRHCPGGVGAARIPIVAGTWRRTIARRVQRPRIPRVPLPTKRTTRSDNSNCPFRHGRLSTRNTLIGSRRSSTSTSSVRTVQRNWATTKPDRRLLRYPLAARSKSCYAARNPMDALRQSLFQAIQPSRAATSLFSCARSRADPQCWTKRWARRRSAARRRVDHRASATSGNAVADGSISTSFRRECRSVSPSDASCARWRG